ncbi:DinB family protein [Terribacillus sp. 179-K 1B1 HS]
MRKDWFDWCKTISYEELTKKRDGSILHNLFHVIDCEQIWIN